MRPAAARTRRIALVVAVCVCSLHGSASGAQRVLVAGSVAPDAFPGTDTSMPTFSPAGWEVVTLAEVAPDEDADRCGPGCRDGYAVRAGASHVFECDTEALFRFDGTTARTTCQVREAWWSAPLAAIAVETPDPAQFRVAMAVVPLRVWSTFSALPPPGPGTYGTWVHLSSGLAGAIVSVDGHAACEGACDVWLRAEPHVAAVRTPEQYEEQRAFDPAFDRTIDFALAARTGTVWIRSRRPASIRVGPMSTRADPSGRTIRLPTGDYAVSIADDCFESDGWPVHIAPGAGTTTTIDPRPRLSPATIRATSDTDSRLEATASVDGIDEIALPFEGDLPQCARLEIDAPHHFARSISRTAPPGETWEAEVELEDARDEDERGVFAGAAQGWTIHAAATGLDLTELSLVDVSDGENLFFGLGPTLRSFAREGGGPRVGGAGIVGEAWGSVSIALVVVRASLSWVPGGGVPGLAGGWSEAGPVAVSLGAAAGLGRLVGPLRTGVLVGFEAVPGVLAGGPTVHAFLTW